MNFPYKECNPYNDKLDVYLLKELKETFCHLNQVSYAARVTIVLGADYMESFQPGLSFLKFQPGLGIKSY